MLYKYIIKNVARQHGKTVTFMPKPLFGDNGSGMHTHQCIWKKGKPLFAGNEYAGLSDMALYYIGGILKHAKALCALRAIRPPTPTSAWCRATKRPVNLAYSARNRSAAIRIPTFSESPKAKRIEYRPPDPAANPYLAFTATADGGSGRDPEQDRSGRTDGQEPLRTAARRAREDSADARPRSRRPWTPWRRTMSSCSRAMCSRRT